MILFRRVLLALAILWIAVLVQRGAPLAPDEVEFFRATRWVHEGQVPYRDFWEHHTPLQWLLFAPAAPDWPGVEAILAMRWVQLALWIAVFALLVRIARRADVDPWTALVLLLASGAFLHRAIEYRVDVPGNLAFVGALALIAGRRTEGGERRAEGGGRTTPAAGMLLPPSPSPLRPLSPSRWVAFGALMSLAVLANMRLAPLVIVTALLALFWREDEQRWRFHANALSMFAGAAAVAALFVAWLFATRAWTPFLQSILDYNLTSAKLLEVDTFFDALLAPLRGDPGGAVFWIAGAIGVVLALRTRRLQFLAVVAIASVVAVAVMEVQYDYHFQTTWLLLLPLAARAIETRPRWHPAVVSLALASLVFCIAPVVVDLGEELAYQDALMTAADRLTDAGETVLDGAGLALRRKPAYRYWFLTTGVRMMAAERLIDPYELRDIASAPPAAVIMDYRLRVYLEAFPDVARYVAAHYLPLYRNLWIPGMTARIERPSRIVWIAPRAGKYDVWASHALVTHPWLRKPLLYPDLQLASRYAIPLRRLEPLPHGALQWRIDGVAQPRGTRTLVLRKGSRVELLARGGRQAGVLLVPHGIELIGLAPADDVVF